MNALSRSAAPRRYKQWILERTREKLADGRPRPPELVAFYREAVARLESELRQD